MTKDYRDLTTLKPGQARVIDGKLWARCQDCGKVGRADGWFRGLHFCVERP
jgi:hypothetical protein